MRTRTELIVIHCSATKPSQDIGAEEIRQWHRKRGWRDIGYHIVIRRDGTVEPGRSLEQVGAHAKGHNDRSVGVCMVGGVNEAGKPDCNFTAAQWASLATEIADLIEMYPDADVIGHRDLSSKACPCFDATAWWQSR